MSRQNLVDSLEQLSKNNFQPMHETIRFRQFTKEKRIWHRSV
ncbi:hypothetical protein CLOSTHATH_03783 [Hungatella hathewayi DSM 13479]|uniref:Uncharacterized protein n=1 Tax=Hungatella hathewayi DSM 13479 TaxID=566550 RepID=D3AJJ2_9FIRM|nr:hypothetical protein CLOSTHATH_03783 [Hungatella hathewayi DSM 13479]